MHQGRKQISKGVKTGTDFIKHSIGKGKDEIFQTIHLEDFINKAFQLPGIQINREAFLRKEFELYYDSDFIKEAIGQTPMMAGISLEEINKIADDIITYESKHGSSVSAALTIPGGISAFATLPMDVMQSFAFLLRCAQKLMYLYGLPQIKFEKNQLHPISMHILVLSFGVMYDLKDASIALKAMCSIIYKNKNQQIIYESLIKGKIVLIVKEIEIWFEKRMAKELLGNLFEKALPVFGAIVGGGITYLSFNKHCSKLKNVLKDTKLSNIKYVESQKENEMMDRILDEMEVKEFLLDLKAEKYEEINPTFLENLSDPKVGFQMRNDCCNGIVVSFFVSSNEAMDYSSKENIIKGFHEGMNQNDALIECGIGKTKKGNSYAYRISKSKINDGISYNLGLNIKMNRTHYYVDGSFMEEGITGTRDSIGFELFKKKLKKENPDYNYSNKEVLKHYYQDPYDPTIERDFLMNACESKEFDSMFPNHPLSELRTYLAWVFEQN